MRTISLSELKQMGYASRGAINHIYLHWSAGHYHVFYDDYHVNVDEDGSLHTSVTSLKEHLNHTAYRNTGAVAISMDCCPDARCWAGGIVDFGSEPPTAEQIDGMAKATAILCEALDLPINKNTVMTHCEAAEIDGYGPSGTVERWDLWKLIDYPSGVEGDGGDIIRGKAIYWQEYWKANPGEKP